jgi:hypothetical protein
MPEIGVERFTSGYRQEYEPERYKANLTVIAKEVHGVERIDRGKDLRIIQQVSASRARERQEPQRHHWAEVGRNASSAARLNRKQTDQDGDG